MEYEGPEYTQHPGMDIVACARRHECTPLDLHRVRPRVDFRLQVGLLFYFVSKTAAAAVLVPYAVSAVLPAKALPWLLNTRFFRCALIYHDFDEVS